VVTPQDQEMRERLLLRFGAICAVLGTVFTVSGGAYHGDLPESGIEAALSFVAPRHDWALVHLSVIVGVLLWVGALVALSSSILHGSGWAFARLGAAFAYVGATIHVVFFSIDGYALKRIADAWAAAPPAEKANLLRAGDLVLLLQNSQFVSAIAFLPGLPYVPFGLAVGFSRIYPVWRGWVGVIVGTGVLFTGMTRFVGLDFVPDPVLFGVFGLGVSLWMMAVGVLMWRRAGSVRGARAERWPP
jgi:hypothetical protein